MQEYIYRDNKEKLVTLPAFVSFDKDEDLGLTEFTFCVSTYSTSFPDKWKQCLHCGESIKKNGLGAHMRSMRCLASRARIQAILDGYVRGPIQYNSLTSPFARRYPTGLAGASKARTTERVHYVKHGSIHMEVWFEFWFAKLWGQYVRPTTLGISEQEKSLVKIPGAPLQKKELQLPQPAHMTDFVDLATGKRKRSKRLMELAKTNLLLTRELTDA